MLTSPDQQHKQGTHGHGTSHKSEWLLHDDHFLRCTALGVLTLTDETITKCCELLGGVDAFGFLLQCIEQCFHFFELLVR